MLLQLKTSLNNQLKNCFNEKDEFLCSEYLNFSVTVITQIWSQGSMLMHATYQWHLMVLRS